MTADQTAVNTRALMAAAAKVERIGYDGDAYRFVEGLVLSVLADGYRRVEKPPPLRGSHSTAQARAAALAECRTAVTAARERRGGR